MATDGKPDNDETTRDGRPPGGVRRDAQGNAVWEWAAAASRQALDSTSRLLRKLEVPGLRLLDDENAPHEGANPSKGGKGGKAASGAKGSAPLPKGAVRNAAEGYDPYGGRGSNVASRAAPATKQGKPSANAPKAGAGAPKAKASFLSRLFGRR